MPQKKWKITDPDTGRSVVIEQDTEPTEAQAIEHLGKSMAPHADRATLGAMMDMSPPSATMERTKQSLPMLGAMAAGAATSGASIPLAMLAEGAGAMAGSATADKLSGNPVDVGKGLWEGAKFAAGSGVIRGLSAAKDIGKSVWSRMSGEGRPQVVEDILSRGRGAATPANSSALYAEQKANAPQVAEGVQAPPDPLLDAAKAHYRVVKNMPSFRTNVAIGSGAGSTIGGMVGGGRGAAIGGGIGGAGAALTHPYVGMAAGQALYNTPNIITQGAQAVNPAVATETMRQLVALMLGGNSQP